MFPRGGGGTQVAPVFPVLTTAAAHFPHMCLCSAEDVLSVRILRLDGLNIGGIAGLELMSHITELYLQRVRRSRSPPLSVSLTHARLFSAERHPPDCEPRVLRKPEVSGVE